MQKVLEEYSGENDDRKPLQIAREAGVEVGDGNKSDINYSSLYRVLDKYKWLALPIFDEESEKQDKEVKVEVESDTEEMMKKFSDMNENTTQDEEELSVIDKLEDAKVAYTIETDEDDFQAIKKLIEAGYDDLAEELFNN